MKKQHYRNRNIITTRTLISVFILLFLILSASALFDYFSRKKAVIDEMALFSRMLAHTIEKSTANSIILNKLLDYYIENWFYSNLSLLNEIEKIKPIDNDFLKQYADEAKIYHINIYNHVGDREYYSHKERQCLNSKMILAPILNNVNDKLVLGIQPFQGNDEDVFLIAVKRDKGGAIVGSLKARRFYAIQGVIGVQQYLNTIASDSSIIYIAIQDSSGIAAKTKNLDPQSLLTDDQIFSDVFNNQIFHWRITNYKNNRIFEAVYPLIVKDKFQGIIRIGLDYSPVQNMQNIVLRQILIRLIILIIISFILFSYSISIQNMHLLEQEKEKITHEVYILQHDLRQKEKMSAVGELAAGIAHEIRNPLGAISMTVQRLGREFKPIDGEDELKRLLDIIRKEIDHISNSIKNLLQFSKPAPLQKSKIRIDQTIAKIIDLYRTKANEKGIALTWHNHTEIEINADPIKIEECLINLIENAIDATPSKGKIEIGLKPQKNDIIIEIQDTGEGIPNENLSKIFNLYFTTRTNGTGLGLAHAQQIVVDHGGTIQVKSKKNEGTTFTIKLPNNHVNNRT